MIPAEKNKTYLGKCNFRGNERLFGMKRSDRRQHTYIIGKTGTGKTTLIENMALQDIYAGNGIGVIDPHGEFAERVLRQVPPERANDVVYFNPVDAEYPIGFNILDVPDPEYKHLVVSDLMGIFTKIWANVWSSRMEYILQNCIMALLDTPGATLLGIPRILVDKNYRQQIVGNVKDPVVRSFWIHEYETWREQFRNEAIVPIQNKVNQFLNTSFIRNIVGQTKSRLNIPQIMNEGKILIVNVSKGRIGEDNSQLLGAMIITKIQLAAMERVRILEEERQDFYLYVDEFQNFATDSFANILSEARKYRLNLIIAHQYVGQLVTDVSTKVRDAVFGNVGTMISFRVGATDAEFLEKEVTPELTMNDLINLPNHHVYLKLMVDGVTSRPFSASTLPLMKKPADETVTETVVEISRRNYGSSRQEVESEIARWSGMVPDRSGGRMDEMTGEKFETPCSNCGKIATVPFKPDGKRPVYCSSCLKQIEEGKLIPLPERMPQERKARFSTTLGELGIEFAPSEATQDRQSRFTPSSSVSHISDRANRDERPRAGGDRTRDTGRVPQRREPFHRRNERRYDTEREQNSIQPAPKKIASESVRRVDQQAKRASLTELKTEESTPLSDGQQYPKKDFSHDRRPNINVLRKALDEALKEEAEKKPSPPVSAPQIIEPGDVIKL